MDDPLIDAATADLLVKVGLYLATGAVALGAGVISTLLWGRGGYKRVKKRLDALESQAREPAITQTVNVQGASSTDERERLLRNAIGAETVESLEKTIRSLPQKPLGDGHTYAQLPDGTNIVSMADGSYRLALPVRLSATFQGGLDGTLSAAVETTTPAIEDDEAAAAKEAWRISPAAGLLAAAAIEKAPNIDEARRIFRAFQAQRSRRNVDEAYEAYIARLKREGLGDTQEAFDVGWEEGGEE